MKRAVNVRKFELGDSVAEADARQDWAAIPPAERLQVVWDMVLEHLAWRDPDAPEPRLQRSVCRVER